MQLRNKTALTEYQIGKCKLAWEVLGGSDWAELDTGRATAHCSLTCYNENDGKVYLGADAYPGLGTEANSRMSMLACLAHEVSHAQRYRKQYRRPFDLPDRLIDEAEASLNGSFNAALSKTDRRDLVEDGRDRLNLWLKITNSDGGDENES